MQSIWDVWLVGAGSNSSSFIYFENKNELCKVVGFLLQVKGIGSAGLPREKSILKQKPALRKIVLSAVRKEKSVSHYV